MAAGQHGLVTRVQVLDSGVSRRVIDRHLSAGDWEPLHRGVYRLAGAPRTWHQQVMAAGRTILDLAAVLPVHQLEIVVDEALRPRLVSVGNLRNGLPVRGASALHALLAQRSGAGSLPGSVLETTFLMHLRRAGLPEPRRQWPVKRSGRTVAVVDFAYPEASLVIEIDGYRYHSGRRDWQRDLARQNEIVACGWSDRPALSG